MKVNKQLMQKARFDRKLISELTVSEFRDLMQQVFDADRDEISKRKQREIQLQNDIYRFYKYGTPFSQGATK